MEADDNSSNNSGENSRSGGQDITNSNLVIYKDHPQHAVEEDTALNDKNLISSGETNVNIFGFTVYDQDGHLVPFDVIMPNKNLYICGYLKSIFAESDDIDEESVPVKDVGPIIYWYEHAGVGCVTLNTKSAVYNLKIPSSQYKPIFDNVTEKLWIANVCVNLFEEYKRLQPTHDDTPLPIPCNQGTSSDAQRNDDPFMRLPCKKELKRLAGVEIGKSQPSLNIKYRKPDKKEFSVATTTPLVKAVFDNLFTNQLDQSNSVATKRRNICRVCEACQQPDCGECGACRAMPKFGGHGRSKECERRLCLNMALEQPHEPNSDDEADETPEDQVMPQAETQSTTLPFGTEYKWIRWLGEPVKTDKNKIYYEKAQMDGIDLHVGNYVMVKTARPNIPSLIARIVCMWKVPNDPELAYKGFFHGEFFIRAADTVLGEVGNPREIFVSDKCSQAISLTSIIRKARVLMKGIPEDWFNLGGKEVEVTPMDDDGENYFCRKYYDLFTARFEDLPESPVCHNPFIKHMFCASCERMKKKEFETIPTLENPLGKNSSIIGPNMTEWSLVRWHNHEYKKGCGVFLKPSTFKLPNSFSKQTTQKMREETMSDDINTEYYRKSCGSPDDILGRPFCVGYIVAVCAWGHDWLVPPQDIYLYVKVMYRPENTRIVHPEYEDLNVVYWSDVVDRVPISAVTGPCHLIYEGNIPPQERSIQQWLEKDPSRFYFRSAYNETTGRVVAVPSYAKDVGKLERLQCKERCEGKGPSKKVVVVDPETEVERLWTPLRTLDVFAGCGGLSAGLHRAGIADCRWAVEHDEAAAHAYALNHEGCSVFNADCNALLSEILSGGTQWAGRPLPKRGEVELLVGGPPCQGFSGMNRFTSRDYSKFKNSLIATYLSFCDFYRPKYFILENVRNFVAYNRGMVLKLTLLALLEMGYQCTFGVLQAGSYGVPQQRRRVFVLAAAPGCPLPHFPEPTHSFLRRACLLHVSVDGKMFTTNPRWKRMAPRRAITVRDALSDLPTISNDADQLEMEYGTPARTHYQRRARRDGDDRLRDHICKKMSPLAQARISQLPTAPGSDWRDLPNIRFKLSNGLVCKKLEYRYRLASGVMRGVCACAEGRPCDPNDRQDNTLIPWFLPHTADRHNQWVGVYGRIDYSGFFRTTVTDPEPSGKQGRVVHPVEARVVSVRECARSQGFTDDYLFTGSVLDKHRQIGNAVPPPLAEALGREIKKAIIGGNF